MNNQDGKKQRKVKMPMGGPILAPKGFTKNAGGKMGEYTGGLAPGVVKPIPGITNGRTAAFILRGGK